MTGLEVGPAVVLATLIWSVARVGVALVEGRTWQLRCRRSDELLHHINAVRVAIDDVRDAVEQLGDRDGGAR